jgi:hypothetical protein
MAGLAVAGLAIAGPDSGVVGANCSIRGTRSGRDASELH